MFVCVVEMLMRIIQFKYFLIISLIILADQITKFIAKENLEHLYNVVSVFPFMNLVYVTNRGVSFGLLSNYDITLYLGILSFVISILLFSWIKKSKDEIEKLSLCLILSGALGNGLDRVFRSYVIDFIDIFYKDFHWPAFNIADSSITIGAILFLGNNFFFLKSLKKVK